MSSSSRFTPEPELTPASLEDRLRRAAAGFAYPETPDLAARVRQRLEGQPRAVPRRRPNRLAFGLVLLLLALSALLLVSPVRARILDWIRIGSVQIFFGQPTATPTPSAAPAAGTGTGVPQSTLTPAPTPTFVRSVLNIGGELPFAQAQEQAGFPIRLPAYPPDLDSPSHVFLQQMNGPVVVLVWVEPNDPTKVRLSISEAPSSQRIFEKYDPKSVQETRVGSFPAVWLDGEYVLVMRNGNFTMTRLITQGHTLIWSTGQMTFRMETDVDLAEAIRIAESIP